MKRLTRAIGKIILASAGLAAFTYLIYQCPNQKAYRQLDAEFQEYKIAIEAEVQNQPRDEYKLFNDFLDERDKKKKKN